MGHTTLSCGTPVGQSSRQISQIIKEDSAVLAVFTTTRWRAVHQPEGQTVAFAYCKPFHRPQVNRETR